MQYKLKNSFKQSRSGEISYGCVKIKRRVRKVLIVAESNKRRKKANRFDKFEAGLTGVRIERLDPN